MCASCGCLRGSDDHGDPRHITFGQLQVAARAAGITVDEVINNIRDTYELTVGLEFARGVRGGPMRVGDVSATAD